MEAIGAVLPGPSGVAVGRQAILRALEALEVPFAVVASEAGPAVVVGGTAFVGPQAGLQSGTLPLLALVPAFTPDRLGDSRFREAFSLRVAHVAGAMANGIASVDVVAEMAEAGMLGFFGAAGLPTVRIDTAIQALAQRLGPLPFGVNLIHSPAEPWQEQETVELLLARRVRAVEASAFLGLTKPLVALRARSLVDGPDGSVRPAVRIMAKVSRPEVAEKFLTPPPAALLDALVSEGAITREQAARAARVPLADALTAEADSGGHTDNRPLLVLLPLLRSLAVRLRPTDPVPVGAAGGIGSPAAVAAAFAMGAAYVVTGTVNQACVEAGTSDLVRDLLAQADLADVQMAPASDMFEAGVELQVLKRGTLFAMRGAELYRTYRAYPSLEALPDDVRNRIERTILGEAIDKVWSDCVGFFSKRDPAQLVRAEQDPKHRMALVFRWYLGRSSRWAIEGDQSRRTDAQIWCGPAIGAFNDWTRGTFLAEPAHRRVATVAANLMAAAALLRRAQVLQDQGVDIGIDPYGHKPRPLADAAHSQDEVAPNGTHAPW